MVNTMQIMTSETVALLTTRHSKHKFSDLIPLVVLTRTPSDFFVKEDSPWKNWQGRRKSGEEAHAEGRDHRLRQSRRVDHQLLKHKGLKIQPVPYHASERHTVICLIAE